MANERLKQLIIASGNAGTTGQSFRNHVTGAASGAKGSEYRISAVAFSGEPVDDIPGGYSDNTLFNITASFTRGARAWNIQRNVSGAWSFPILSSPSGASATLESFSAGGSPTGATHALGLRVRGPYGGTPSFTATAEQPASLEPANPETDPWPVRYSLSVSGGGTGQTAITILPSYVPDLGAFNASLGAAWPLTINNRPFSASAYEIQWRTAASGGGSLLSGSAVFSLLDSTRYPSGVAGLLPQEELTIYLRYRLIGTSTWTNHGGTGAVFYHDDRPAV